MWTSSCKNYIISYVLNSKMSIKVAKRARRVEKGGQTSHAVYCDVVSKKQRLPQTYGDLFRRTCNKIIKTSLFTTVSDITHQLNKK